MSTPYTPIMENERIDSLDMMRGLALLGILLANSRHFQFGLFLTPDVHDYYPLGLLDLMAEKFILLFAAASFYTLFSFLFGYGMSLLKERLEQRERRFGTTYFRRMFLLFIFGALHYLFIWNGDILISYAIAGCILYFFLKLKERGLFIWASILLLVMALSIATPDDKAAVESSNELFYPYSVKEKEVLTSGSYFDVLSFRVQEDPLNLGGWGIVVITLASIISILGMFLLGAYVARRKWLLHLELYRKQLKRIWWITLLVGFPSKMAFLINDSIQYEMLHTTIGGPLVALFYASSIALVTSNQKGKRLLQPLTYVGRLSLTNYLLQSIVFTFLFYGYGIGLFSSLGYFAGVMLSFIFFVIQILLSKWWLHRFLMGPVEWIWRIGTYLHLPQLKR